MISSPIFMLRALLFLVGLQADGVMAAESKPIPLHATEPEFRQFLASLRAAAKNRDAAAVYSSLASDYYVARDFGGSFDPSASPIRNFSTTFQFDNTQLAAEFKDHGWIEFRRAISGNDFERKHNGQLCMPHGAQDMTPFPHPQLCFRKFKDGWRIQGYINGGD